MDFTKSLWIQNCRSGRRGMCISVVLLGIIVGSALLAYSAFSSKKDHHSIKQIAIIFRHGARNPTETYANDPHLEHRWEDGWGALTKEGMKQLYSLGQWLQDEYGLVIGRKYHSKTTLVQSSFADRCIMSAQSLLAALYRPEPGDYFYHDLPWRPVPVHSIPRNLDKLITMKHPCPTLEKALREAYANESAKSEKELASYYSDLSYHTGQKIATITDVEFLYNTLEIEEQRGLKLPGWTKNFYNSKMREIASRSLTLFTSNALQRRLRGGPLLKEITDNMMDARNNHNEKKLYLYSAHDITLVNVLRAMGLLNELFKPEYGAALIFELVLSEYMEESELELEVKLNITLCDIWHLLKDTTRPLITGEEVLLADHIVICEIKTFTERSVHILSACRQSSDLNNFYEVKYLNNTEMYEAVPIEIPRCREPCKLLNLLHVWQDILPTNWDLECNI